MGRRPQLPTVYLPAGQEIYVCRFTAHGRRYHLGTGKRDRSEAIAEAERLHAEAQLKRLPVRQRRAPVTDETGLSLIAALWLEEVEATKAAWTHRGYRSCVERAILKRWAYVSEIDTNSIAAWITDRSKTIGSVTINRELVALSQLLTWCKRQKLIEEVPTFERPRAVSNYAAPDLSRADVLRVLAKLPTRETHSKRYPAREFFTVLWGMGLRHGELQTLQWSDVDLDNRRLTIRAGRDKARKGRTIGIAADAHAVLSSMPRGPGLVFGPINMRKSLSIAAEAAGVDWIHHHGLRHARLTELASASHDTAALQYFAGHLHMATTDLYVRSRTERTHALVDAADSGHEAEKMATKAKSKKGAKR